MKNVIESSNRMIIRTIILGETAVCGLLFYSMRQMPWWTHEQTTNLREIIWILMLCYLLCAMRTGVVLHQRKARVFHIVGKVLSNVITSSILMGIVLWSGNFISNGYEKMWIFPALLFPVLLIFRLSAYKLIRAYHRRKSTLKYVVMVGCTENNREVMKELTRTEWSDYRVLGYFDHEPYQGTDTIGEYLGTPDQVINYLEQHKEVQRLFCCLPSKEKDTIVPIIDYCENHLVHFYSVPNVSNYLHNKMYMNMLGDTLYLSLRPNPLNFAGNRFIKRTFDIVFSLAFLCTLFPIILLIVTVITKLTMPGPVFFKQKRSGLNDKEFYCYKFRSMKVNKDADRVQATKNDPRKTKWGNIMRKTNIDELPQFINVLKGDMSVVGPRPHMLKHTEEYSKLINKYMVRHFVKPGVTGWSQVTGFRGETKELSEMEGRIRGDIWYIENWSFSLDLYIIYRTVANVFKGEEKAY